MGFGDKLKGLREQAQQAVVENKDKIQGAVQVAGDVANAKTHGRYATKIAKVGEKVEQSIEKVAQGEGAAVGTDDASAAANVSEPPAPGASSEAAEATAGFPEFE